MTERERIADFLNEAEDTVCDEVRPGRCGTALLTPSLPLVWQVNALRVEDPDAGPDDVAEEADALLEGLGHRQLFVPDADLGARLAPALSRRGWNVTRLLVMVLRRSPDRRSPAGLGAEVDRRTGAEALAMFRREQSMDGGSETICQLEEMDERFGRAFAARDFASPPAQGYACCRLLAGAGLGQVDQVGTLKAHRNRGHARAAVLAALEAALFERLDPVFLLTDARDWPQYLYRRLGFDPVAVEWEFLKLPLGSTPP
ncbi:MAG TPA: hypothetical protein VFQ12_10780 [Thermoleophilaceae bacterium]|nr:hypothetical protein [Thermoleophilaceae bacterium]